MFIFWIINAACFIHFSVDYWGRQPALPNLPVAGFFFPAWQVFPALPDMPPKSQWQVFGRFSIFD